MTLDDLLRLADLSRGSSPDPLAQQKRNTLGYERARPSFPMPSAPAPVIGNAAETSPFSRLDASGMGDAGILERIGAHAPSSPIAALIDLTGTILRGGHSGYGDAMKRARLNLASDKLTQEHTDTRKARDDAFQKAKDAATAHREAVTKQRTEALSAAIQRKRSRLTSLSDAARIPGISPEELAGIKAEFKRLSDEVAANETDLAKLGGMVDESGAPLLPEKPLPPKPEKPDKEAQGQFVTAMTPQGPRYMRASEAQAKGYPPAGARDSRVASAQERQLLADDTSITSQLQRIKDLYLPDYVGPLEGRVTGAAQKVTSIDPDKAKFRSALSGIRNQILKMRSGGAVTEGEAARLLEEMPTANDPASVFESKLATFEDIFRTAAEARRQNIEASGVDLSKFEPLPPKAAVSRTVLMRSPNGDTYQVPKSEVTKAKAKGWKRVKSDG